MYRFFCFALLSATFTLVGCGEDGASGGLPVFQVSGNVKMHGAPLPNATVAFAPETAKQLSAIGTTDAQGNFELTTYISGDGAVEGSYKVVISKYAAPAVSDDSGEDGKDHDADDGNDGHAAAGDGADEGTALVPPQYLSSESTPLRAEVKAGGENVFSFEIE